MPSGAKSRNINKKRPSEKVEQQRGGGVPNKIRKN